MNTDPENERLLDDILAEESEPGFRDALFERTIYAVRQRRRFRKTAKAGSVIAVLGLLALLCSRYLPTKPVSLVHKPVPPAAATYVLVRTEPLPKSELVLTQPFNQAHQLSSSRTVAMFSTSDVRAPAAELSDEQLLDLAGPAPVALVRQGPHAAELVFVNPKDRENLFRN